MVTKMTKKILLFLTIVSSQAFTQEITKEHWTSCLQIIKDERNLLGSTIVDFSARHEFTMVVKFKGEKDGWHRIAYGVEGGLRDGEQSVLLAKLEKDGLWVKNQGDERAKIAFPFPLKVGQKWVYRDGGTISLVGIQDFEAVGKTYKDCLVFETESQENKLKTKGELWYAPDVGLLFSKEQGAVLVSKEQRSAYLRTMRIMPKGEKLSGSGAHE